MLIVPCAEPWLGFPLLAFCFWQIQLPSRLLSELQMEVLGIFLMVRHLLSLCFSHISDKVNLENITFNRGVSHMH